MPSRLLRFFTAASAAAILLFSAGAAVFASPPPVRVACVGDSITFGAGVPDRVHMAYPAVLGGLLGPHYQVVNFGVSGATLLKNGNKPYWKQPAFQRAADFQPQIVVIKLGTNDSKPVNWAHRDEFAADAAGLAGYFAQLPSKPAVWLCLPLPAFSDAYTIQEKNLVEIRAILRKVAAEKGLRVIDPTPAFAGHPELFRDGIHPNQAGAALLAKTVAAALQTAVQ
ncbi:MAG TPA: GDSL-type esterase/lipase family protein [Opitutaceae bacterium]|nr:GDSL-type esterase/lipase family protein [Opitutaceae bacterium]